jgi:phosphoenolpyruvate carboxykinase (ATP)
MYHFISGYTAKVAGTEEGVNEPEATFSACFGAAFLVWHPGQYARMLADNMQKHFANAWLINTGFTGGAYGTGRRMSLKHTRAIIDAIHDGSLAQIGTTEDPVFGLAIPNVCPNVPTEILQPRNTWADKTAFDRTARKLASLFAKNFQQYKDGCGAEVLEAAEGLEAAVAA